MVGDISKEQEMDGEGKTRKPYARPVIERVRLEMEEAVLQACKVNAAEPSRVKRNCTHPACKRPGS
ncbi:MAG: hypothetical protein JRJ03_01705 [Deltaproteobacteria bacterium]|nr:hypothetical protein [Deltaproteobacteria bacterium]